MKRQAAALIAGIAIGSISTLLLTSSPPTRNGEPVHDDAPRVQPQASADPEASAETLMALRQEVARLAKKLSEYETTETARRSDEDAEKAKYIAFALKRYESLFELAPRQKELIGELEWESKQFWEEARAGKINMSEAELPDLDGNVARVLTEEQNRVYQKHLESKKDSSAELASSAFLSRVPVTLNLSDEQKDEIYKNLYVSLHSDTQAEFQQRWEATKNPEFDQIHQMIVWAAEEALTDEQFEKLKQAFKQ